MFGPFNVKDAPAFVHFRILLAFGGQLDKGQWNAVFRAYFDVERHVFGDMRQPAQAVDVIGLRVLSLGKHHDRAQYRALTDAPLEGFSLSSAWGHIDGQPIKPRARRISV